MDFLLALRGRWGDVYADVTWRLHLQTILPALGGLAPNLPHFTNHS